MRWIAAHSGPGSNGGVFLLEEGFSSTHTHPALSQDEGANRKEGLMQMSGFLQSCFYKTVGFDSIVLKLKQICIWHSSIIMNLD